MTFLCWIFGHRETYGLWHVVVHRKGFYWGRTITCVRCDQVKKQVSISTCRPLDVA